MKKGGFFMKLKRIVAIALAVLMVFGTISIKGGVQAETNTVTVKASQISGCKYCVKDTKGNLRLEINESVDLTIDMDVDLYLTGISNYYKVYPNISITLKGNKTLTLSSFSIESTRNGGYGLLNITSIISSSESAVIISYSFNSKSYASAKVNSGYVPLSEYLTILYDEFVVNNFI